MNHKIGCGKYVKFWNRYCGQIEDLKHSEHIILCDDCACSEEEKALEMQHKTVAKVFPTLWERICMSDSKAGSACEIFLDLEKSVIDKAVARQVFKGWMKHLRMHIGTGEIDDCEGKLHYLEIIYKELGLEEE